MKIGIFWYYQHKVVGIAHIATTVDSLGLADSPYAHVSYWKELQAQIPVLMHLEYEEVPRGRVIFDSNRQKLGVFLDAKLLKKDIVNKIAAFFDAEYDDLILRKDPHYKT